jgi:NAD-reducing hydrogenase small subunit
MSAPVKVRVATAWLDGCSGCHMSILDTDELLIELVRKIDLVYGPLVDAQEFPEGIDVAIVEGAISSSADRELAQTIRARSRYLIALGDCAVTSNVPSMRNSVPARELLQRIYVEGVDTQPGVPVNGVPPLLRQAVPVHDVVRVDLHVPGCPPKADAITYVLTEVLAGRKPDLAGRVKFG